MIYVAKSIDCTPSIATRRVNIVGVLYCASDVAMHLSKNIRQVTEIEYPATSTYNQNQIKKQEVFISHDVERGCEENSFLFATEFPHQGRQRDYGRS